MWPWFHRDASFELQYEEAGNVLCSIRKLRAIALCASVVASVFGSASSAKAEVFLVKKEKVDDWEVSTNGRVDAYLSWISGETKVGSTRSASVKQRCASSCAPCPWCIRPI